MFLLIKHPLKGPSAAFFVPLSYLPRGSWFQFMFVCSLQRLEAITANMLFSVVTYRSLSNSPFCCVLWHSKQTDVMNRIMWTSFVPTENCGFLPTYFIIPSFHCAQCNCWESVRGSRTGQEWLLTNQQLPDNLNFFGGKTESERTGDVKGSKLKRGVCV